LANLLEGGTLQLEQATVQTLLGGSAYFGVPVFQRDYVWRSTTLRAEVDQLLDDLTAAHQTNAQDHYFLGSMVVFDDLELDRRMLVDGQQRTITLVLLLSSMRRRLEALRTEQGPYADSTLDEAEENLLILLRQCVRWVRDDPSNSALRFRFPDDASNDVLTTLVTHGGDHLTPGTGGNRYYLVRATRKAEQFLADGFPSREDLQEFARFVLSRVDLVVIHTPDLSTAYRIFWTLNDRGRALTASDLLKNFLFAQHRGSRRESRQLADVWRGITNILQNSGEPTPDRFLRYYVIANVRLDRAVSARMLFPTIQENGSALGWNNPSAFAQRLADGARYFSHLKAGQAENGRAVKPLQHIRGMAPTVTQPLAALLAVPQRLRHGAALNELCEALETMTLVYGMTRERWNQFERALPDLTERLRRAASDGDIRALAGYLVETQIKPRSREFWSALEDVRNVPDRTQRFLVASLALAMQEQCRASEYREIDELMVLTIEHIAPQCSLNDEDDRGRAWRIALDVADGSEAGQLVYMLGNLTLLPAEVNSMIGALPFGGKADTYARQPVLLTKAIAADIREGQSTGRREFADRHDLHPFGDWTPESIRSRHEWLLGRVAERWPLLPDHQ
jgi:hypothetical protein